MACEFKQLSTGCIFEPTPRGVLRASIMREHWYDTRREHDPRYDDTYHLHQPQLAANVKLLGDYYLRNHSWEFFEERYRDHMTRVEQRKAMEKLLDRLQIIDIALLCKEEKPHQCHRRILAEILEEVYGVRVVVK